ncbi:DDE-type integrase/transposase/recombinase [Azospirillum argentinense]|uniref:DDE-type integrase/transposase/recombinase n=1 Tax=Azospirillum argentinense TaxID=2970906 RepID=UPI00158C1026
MVSLRGEAVIAEGETQRIKRLVRPGRGFKSVHTARRSIDGYEIMTMVRKRQVATIPANDMPDRAAFIPGLFGIAARQC